MDRSIKIVLGGVFAWIAYEWWKGTATAATASSGLLGPSYAAAIGTGPAGTLTLPGSLAPTLSDLSFGGTMWGSLTPVSALTSGYINFPSGSQAAAAAFGGGNTAIDGQGNYYVLWAGQTYRLGGMDGQGNWPAMLVAS